MACQILADDLDLITGVFYILSLIPKPYSVNNDNYLLVNFDIKINAGDVYSGDIAIATFDDINDLYTPPDEIASKIEALKLALKFENTLLYLHNGKDVYCKLLKPMTKAILEAYSFGNYEVEHIEELAIRLRSGGHFCAENFPGIDLHKLAAYVDVLRSVSYDRPWLNTAAGTIRRRVVSALLANTLHIYE